MTRARARPTAVEQAAEIVSMAAADLRSAANLLAEADANKDAREQRVKEALRLLESDPVRLWLELGVLTDAEDVMQRVRKARNLLAEG